MENIAKMKGIKMSILKINETPVRTARNFLILTMLKLEDIQMPEKISRIQRNYRKYKIMQALN